MTHRAGLRSTYPFLFALGLFIVLGCSEQKPIKVRKDPTNDPIFINEVAPPILDREQAYDSKSGGKEQLPAPRVVLPKETLDAHVARLRHPDPRQRAGAAKVLAELGAPALPTLHDLLPLLDDSDLGVQTEAARAIVAIGRPKFSGLVDFGASWCPPCRTMNPIVEGLKDEGLPILLVDIDQNHGLSVRFGVGSIPTFIRFDNDQESKRNVGAMPESELRKMLKGLRKVKVPQPLALSDDAQKARVMALLLGITGEDEWVKFLSASELRLPQLGADSVLNEIAAGKYPDRIRYAALTGLLFIHRETEAPAEIVTLLKRLAGNAKESVNIRGFASAFLYQLKTGEPSMAANLLAALENGTVTEVREVAAKALGELQLVQAVPALTKALGAESFGLRKSAVEALGAIGSPAGPAVSALFDLYEKEGDSELSAKVKQTLMEIVPTAPDGVAAMIAAARSDQQRVKLLAAELLNLADDPGPATAQLQMLLKDADPNVRIQAAMALQRLSLTDARVLTALLSVFDIEQENFQAIAALQSEGPKVALRIAERVVNPKSTLKQKLRAVTIYNGLFWPAKNAETVLTKGLTSENREVAACAALCVTNRFVRGTDSERPADPAVVRALKSGLKSPDADLKMSCVRALGSTQSPAAVAPLLLLLRDKQLAIDAGYALSRLPRDEKTVNQLNQFVNDERTQSAALPALGNLHEHQELAVHGLISAFSKAEDEQVLASIGSVLRTLGKPALTQLTGFFEAQFINRQVRLAAISAAGRMRDDTGELTKRLEKLLKDPKADVQTLAAIGLAYQDSDADVTDLLLDAITVNLFRNEAGAALENLGVKGAKSVDVLIAWLKGPDNELRGMALRVLPSVGRDSPKAIAETVLFLKSTAAEEDRRYAFYALRRFGDLATPALIKVMDDPGYSRSDVIAALRQFGPLASDAREPLVKLLGNEDRSLALSAALALTSIDSKNNAPVPVLIEGMRSPNRRLRIQSIMALGKLGRLAKPAVPELVRALQSKSSRYVALHALEQIGPDAAPAVEALTKLLHSVNSNAVANTLGALGREASPAIPALLRMLENQRAQRHSAEALSKIGGEAKQSVSLLAARLADNDQIGPACEMLAIVGRLDPDQTLSALRGIITNSDPDIRAAAIRALGPLKSNKTTPDLLAALKDPELTVRLAAVEALGESGQEAETTVARLVELLDDKETRLREGAAKALGELGSKAEKAVPALVKALANKQLRRFAIDALGKIGKALGAPIPQLAELLDDRQLRLDAVSAVGQMGPAAKSLLPKLKKLASDRDPLFAGSARTAIDRIEGREIIYFDDDDYED